MTPIQPIATIEVDCIGQLCPAPVIRLAREAAKLGADGGTLAIRADDPAFRLDLEAWARGTSAQIIAIEAGPAGVVRALVAIGDARYVQAPPQASAANDATLDLRDGVCPAPIEALTAAAAAQPTGSLIHLVADDPRFAVDLCEWLRSGRAELVSFAATGETRACLRIAASEPPLAAGARGRPPTAPVAPAAPVPPTSPTAATLLAPPTAATLLAPPTAATLLALGKTDRAASLDASAEGDVAEQRDGCTLLVLHNDHEALLAALLVANGAAAQGMRTSLFFTFWGLNLLRGDHPDPSQPRERVGLLRRLMKWMMPKGPRRQRLGQMHFAGAGKGMLDAIMRAENILGLPELMRSAEALGVGFTACTMSMSVMGITKRDLHPYPNLEFAGVSTFVERARHSSISLVF